MYRTGAYDEKLAKKLQKPKNAREFLLGLMEEGEMTLIDALRHTIRKIGVKEFAELSEIHEKSISRMLNTESMPKLETLDEYLAPFGLKVKLVAEKMTAA